MGCVDSSVQNSDHLRSQLMKLKFGADIQKTREDQELKKTQKQLSIEFIKPPKVRNKNVERVLIIGNARLSNKKNIYLHIENESKIILERWQLMSQEAGMERVKQSLNVLLYCSEFLNFQYLERFSKSFWTSYPDYPRPTDKDINNDLIKAEKKGEVPFSSEVEYILQYSQNHGITMEHINSIGHGYKYGSQKYGG